MTIAEDRYYKRSHRLHQTSEPVMQKTKQELFTFNSDMKEKFYLVSNNVYDARNEFITSDLGHFCIHD